MSDEDNLDITKAVLCSKIAYKIKDSDKYYRTVGEISEAFGVDNHENITIEPFYKERNDNEQYKPGGYIIKPNEDEVIIAFRGTTIDIKYAEEMNNDTLGKPKAAQFDENKILLHSGFLEEYNRSKENFKNILRNVDNLQDKKITIVGHSLGGAIAQIAALDLITNDNLLDKDKVSIVTFGSPKVFAEYEFADMMKGRLGERNGVEYYNNILGDKTTNIHLSSDPIQHFPFIRNFYKHVGSNVSIDTKNILSHGIESYIGEIKNKEEIRPNIIIEEYQNLSVPENNVPRFEQYRSEVMLVVQETLSSTEDNQPSEIINTVKESLTYKSFVVDDQIARDISKAAYEIWNTEEPEGMIQRRRNSVAESLTHQITNMDKSIEAAYELKYPQELEKQRQDAINKAIEVENMSTESGSTTPTRSRKSTITDIESGYTTSEDYESATSTPKTRSRSTTSKVRSTNSSDIYTLAINLLKDVICSDEGIFTETPKTPKSKKTGKDSPSL